MNISKMVEARDEPGQYNENKSYCRQRNFSSLGLQIAYNNRIITWILSKIKFPVYF